MLEKLTRKSTSTQTRYRAEDEVYRATLSHKSMFAAIA